MSEREPWSARDQFKRNAQYHLEHANGAARKAIVIKAEDVTPEEVRWIWPGRLARGKISVLEGDPGLGKSVLTCEVAARLSRGQRLPGGLDLPPLGTLFLAGEDTIADTIVPRLIAAGGDRSRIRILGGIMAADGTGDVAIPQDLDIVEEVITEQQSALVIVDPLAIFLAEGVNENSSQEIKRALSPLRAMLERTMAAALAVRHLNKRSGGKAIYRGAGSIGLGGMARAVMAVGKDPEDETLRVLANVKENLTEPMPSLAYRTVPNPDNPAIVQISWHGTSVWSAEDIGGEIDPEESGRLADAVVWLGDYLRGGVIAKSKQVYRDAAADDHTERTIRRAKKSLGVESLKNPADGTWGWRLPDESLATFEDGHVKVANPRAGEDVGHLGHLHKNTHNNNKSLWPPSLATFEGGHGHLDTSGIKGAKGAKGANAYGEGPQ